MCSVFCSTGSAIATNGSCVWPVSGFVTSVSGIARSSVRVVAESRAGFLVMSNVVYLADSGRATSGSAAPATKSTNARAWKLEFTDPADPTKAQISVVIQGDDQATKAPDEIHQPDNLETTANGSLFVLEDPSTNNQFAYPSVDANRTSARSGGSI